MECANWNVYALEVSQIFSMSQVFRLFSASMPALDQLISVAQMDEEQVNLGEQSRQA